MIKRSVSTEVLGVKTRTANDRIRELEAAGLLTRETVRSEGLSGARVTTIIHMDRIEALPRVDADW